MNVLAVNGSPRKGGNTEMLLKEVLGQLEDAGWNTEYVHVGGKNLRGCQACSGCFKHKNMRCVMADDGFNNLFARMLKADAIVLGSPTYFTDVSAEMKALLDRSGYVAGANSHALAGKIGAAVVAVRRAGATHAFDTINHMFLMSQMVVPGSTYWNLGVGLRRGDVAGDDEGMGNMRHLGRVIDWLGRAIQKTVSHYPAAE